MDLSRILFIHELWACGKVLAGTVKLTSSLTGFVISGWGGAGLKGTRGAAARTRGSLKDLSIAKEQMLHFLVLVSAVDLFMVSLPHRNTTFPQKNHNKSETNLMLPLPLLSTMRLELQLQVYERGVLECLTWLVPKTVRLKVDFKWTKVD